MSGGGWTLGGALSTVSAAETLGERVQIVKTAVGRQMQALTHRADVKFTDYFNHTYTPDMILRDRDGMWERELFIRLTADPEWLTAQYPQTATPKPLVVPVEAFPPDATTDPSWLALKQRATADHVWVADVSALTHLADEAASNPVNELLGQSLVRGGQGLDSGRTITDKAASVALGFEAAKHADPKGTGLALETIADSLDDAERNRLTRVLRAIWVGNQGAESSFPNASTLEGMTPGDVDYLIESLSDGDPSFWRTIGRGLKSEQLTSLNASSVESLRFQQIVSGALPWLRTKAVYAKVSDPDVLGDREPAAWTVAAGCLAVRGPHWICYLAASAKGQLPTPKNATRVDPARGTNGILWREAIRRLEAAQARVLAAGWVDGQYEHTVIPLHPEAGDVLSAERVGANPVSDRVTELTVTGEGVPSLTIDFDESTAGGATATKYDTAPLLRIAVPMLVPLNSDEQAEVVALLHTDGVGLDGGAEQLRLS